MYANQKYIAEGGFEIKKDRYAVWVTIKFLEVIPYPLYAIGQT